MPSNLVLFDKYIICRASKCRLYSESSMYMMCPVSYSHFNIYLQSPSQYKFQPLAWLHPFFSLSLCHMQAKVWSLTQTFYYYPFISIININKICLPCFKKYFPRLLKDSKVKLPVQCQPFISYYVNWLKYPVLS